METNQTTTLEQTATQIISRSQLLEHWQGHRGLTRKVIEAFPEDQFCTFSIGGMRPFSMLTMEIIDLARGIRGIATGDWEPKGQSETFHPEAPATKQEVLALWDEVTSEIESFWPQITESRFQETDKAFGMYDGTVYSLLFYFIDNEIHHRGQGYVYLRALGIEPPAFWDREEKH